MILSSNLRPCRLTNVFLTYDDDEALKIHKRDGSEVFRVNAPVAYIWQLCDGKQDISQITDTVRTLNTLSDEIVEEWVSDTIGELFSRGMLDFNKAKVKPFARIAFTDLDVELSHLHNFLISQFGEWFDLQIVDSHDDMDIYINIGSPDDYAVKFALRI